MRTFAGFFFACLSVTGILAQNRSGFVNNQSIVRTFGSVVYPGGTSALPGVQRTTGSVVYPGGGGPQIGVPGLVSRAPFSGRFSSGFVGQNPAGRSRNRSAGSVTIYPLYVGGYGSYYDPSYAAPQGAPDGTQSQPPNIVVIYPQQAVQPTITMSPSGEPSNGAYQLPGPSQTIEVSASGEATHYLIAFKDHTIYSAIAYWVDGDTLHYFTTGSTHNQVSLSLVDRELTQRLNKDSGLEVNLPAPR